MWTLLIITLIAIIYYLWISLPIISGYAAKQIATWVFVAKRNVEDVQKSDTGWFPISLARNKVDMENGIVTSTVFGVAKKKVVFREKAGCTLINKISEAELRRQDFDIKTTSLPHKKTQLWPEGTLKEIKIPDNIDPERLNAAVGKAFTEQRKGKKQRTRAVVVVYDGRLITEKYAPGFTKDTRMYGWSMTKSITAALLGILVKQGKIDVKSRAPVPEWNNKKDPRYHITIEDLLHQMSGIGFSEVYTRASGVTNMLYKQDDMGSFAARFSLKNPPDTNFYYSSGNSNILSKIIRQHIPIADYTTFPYRELLYKIGMNSAVFEPDASGTFVGSSYIHATARDYARFGLLYMNDGVWNGERILPEGWVKSTVTSPLSNKLRNYGYQFWLNGFTGDSQLERSFKDVPQDLFYCHGFGQQGVFIIPSKKLIVVRLGLSIDQSFDENIFLKEIIGSISNG